MGEVIPLTRHIIVDDGRDLEISPEQAELLLRNCVIERCAECKHKLNALYHLRYTWAEVAALLDNPS